MTDSYSIPKSCDVAIIGAGPSGLATATELKRLGVESVVIIEREASAGGIPRHCGHSPFGMREFKRVLSGKQYTKKLTDTAQKAGVTILLNTTVGSINKGAELQLSNHAGLHTFKAKKVIICTGIRETPRSTRLISGQRPLGIVTTGALQSTVYLKHKKPFRHPVIIGTELVSFSALMTCLHSGARPVAMIEQNSRITARWGLQFLAALFRVPIYYDTQLSQINGKQRVESVDLILGPKITENINCDGVVFSGKFVAESSLLRMGHLDVDKVGNPMVDQFGRCSDPDYFATGNMTHPVETAGHCWSHGIQTAQQVFADLNGELEPYDLRLKICSNSGHIKYHTPQYLAVASDNSNQKFGTCQIRVNSAVKGQLSIKVNDDSKSHKHINAIPERHIDIYLPYLFLATKETKLELCFEPS